MFAKLLKHEWRANWRILSLLSLSSLGIGVLGAIVLQILRFSGDAAAEDFSPILTLVTVMLSFALVFLCIALGLYTFAVQLLLLYRFYKHKFTDEGYLTFTLPVTSRQIFLSAWLNMVIWMVFSGIAVTLSIAIALLFGTADHQLINTELITDLVQGVLHEMEFFPEVGIFLILFMVTSLLSFPAITMSCITLGAVLAKKHKLLAAFGIYYGISFVLGIVGSVLMFAVLIVSDLSQTELFLENTYLLEGLLQLGIAAGGYFLSVHLMRTKLNLP